MSEIHFRAIDTHDAENLKRMLYLAIHVPPGSRPPPLEIVEQPELARYVEAWGRAGDLGVIAVDQHAGRMLGAAWLRVWNEAERGYGYVDLQTPELSIAVEADHRGRGIGTELMHRLLAAAAANHRAVSLSVSADNPAVRLYERLGFVKVHAGSGSITMVRDLSAGTDSPKPTE